jgi:hypothetical protein
MMLDIIFDGFRRQLSMTLPPLPPPAIAAAVFDRRHVSRRHAATLRHAISAAIFSDIIFSCRQLAAIALRHARFSFRRQLSPLRHWPFTPAAAISAEPISRLFIFDSIAAYFRRHFELMPLRATFRHGQMKLSAVSFASREFAED